jgi:polyphosphate kinase
LAKRATFPDNRPPDSASLTVSKPSAPKEDYDAALYELQVELVKLQRHVIDKGLKLLIILEGRDSAGKDGAIKRIVEHLSPRESRVVALGKPSDREASQFYFQRWTAHLPAAGEMVLFNRSWYNRAGVERVMGFCNDEQYREFLHAVPLFERMLVESEIHLCKLYLDITLDEQTERLEARKKDPLKQWKISPIDAVALDKFDDYTRARDAMLKATHHPFGPWFIVNANKKKPARLNLIRHLLGLVDYPKVRKKLLGIDPQVLRPYSATLARSGFLHR